jgi:hypothetical protein
MKGFSAWPGKIEIPTDGMKRPAMKKVRQGFLTRSHTKRAFREIAYVVTD